MIFYDSKNLNRGFTLIELLVVISIIGVLSSTVMVAVKDARNKANDKALLSSAIQLRNALELYKEDHGGLYPGEPATAFFVSVQKNSTRVYKNNGGGISYDELASALSPYIQGNILDPIYFDDTPYLYYHFKNFRCVGQTKDPRYVIYINPKTDLGIPKGLKIDSITGAGLVMTYSCISSPE